LRSRRAHAETGRSRWPESSRSAVAHDLVIEARRRLRPAIIDHCDEATARFKQAGRAELHGIHDLDTAKPATT
jgi:hypothetical protein